MSKSPYELRMELLSMSKELLDKNYDTAVSLGWQGLQHVSEAVEKGNSTSLDFMKEAQEYMPKMFTPEEIIAQAEKLQAFINKKD
jgi:hypothetical protein